MTPRQTDAGEPGGDPLEQEAVRQGPLETAGIDLAAVRHEPAVAQAGPSRPPPPLSAAGQRAPDTP
jgi:hypothetical protein